MALSSYSDRLKKATESATKATLLEASLSSLSPLTSPIPTLHKAFPLYISAAEQYSLLLSAGLVPESEKLGIKKKWRLVLERAEKVKKRIEELGGHVGKVGVGDEVGEEAIIRRGGSINGLDLDIWSGSSKLRGVGDVGPQPELAKEQEALDPEWAEPPARSWDARLGDQRWVIRQGPGADCSVVAGFGACLEHNRRWGTTLGREVIFPQAGSTAIQSDNGRHVVKLLLNGAWRGVLIDALLPRSKDTHLPLHATSHPTINPSSTDIGPPWVPLILKAYFKAFGGYSLRGSDPSLDVYTLTGWIPERISFRGGFQREKEWRRIRDAWRKGDVIVTLGTGGKDVVGEGLVPLHAYAVLDIEEDDLGERMMTIYDPGISKTQIDHQRLDVSDRMNQLKLEADTIARFGIFRQSWDAVCSDFETLNLNWNPGLLPECSVRHWSWPKPSTREAPSPALLRYRLTLTTDRLQKGDEVWILLSQHITNKDRSLDDIALTVYDERGSGDSIGSTITATAISNPYSNAVHVLYRYTLRKPSTTLIVMPLRDRGLYRTDFTLQAFSPANHQTTLERMSTSLPFSAGSSGALTTKTAGGHAGLPSWGQNPQYKLVVGSPQSRHTGPHHLRVNVQGDSDVAWNAKLLLGKGQLVFELDDEKLCSDSGPYSYGIAYLDTPDIQPGSYTLSISSFEPRKTGDFILNVESALPVSLEAIPAEGAGMYSRTISGVWTEQTSGGRPSGGTYEINPTIEITLPRECSIMARGILPIKPGTPVPLNVTLFRRAPGSTLGEQVATSGPYSDAASGVNFGKSKVRSGVYSLVISPWQKGMGIGEKWEVRIWADGPLEVELLQR